jgi:very-short-patch-repair endonuclease
VAILTEDPTTSVIRVEGPPGTGKSLTIANLACHLAATGKTVLITSQKDKALQVVDEKLRELNLPELPMTLLRHDRSSKQELLDRLARIKKERARQEVERDFATVSQSFSSTAASYLHDANAYRAGVTWEEYLERAHRSFTASSGIRRLIRQVQFLYARRKVQRLAPETTDEISKAASKRRDILRDLALKALQVGRELSVAAATRQERQGLRELAQILQRNQTSAKNFSLFDRLKADPQRATMLLKLLPVWILAPEDVARLFPCLPGLFDVVIVDEASQVDLPSVTPIVYRGKKAVIFGDTKQMQPRRFAFMNANIVSQAWQHAGMERHDPERRLHPAENSLLALGNIRAEEENLLDEHFRSLPPIIDFSNREYYGQALRIMTDERYKIFGHPKQPITELHLVGEGKISNGSQENETEARAVVQHLSKLVTSEDYSGASIGVICLFEEQAALLQEFVAEQIPEEEWEEHAIVVVTPDGFQGDERDVILYSLSWDNDVMPRQALSQRQRNHPHEQGMLNVAFTRARDEIHIFHSAPVDTFTLADGRPGALTRWLQHCAAVQAAGRPKPAGSRIGQVDSEFEAEVASALQQRGIFVFHQYPACGFHIDLVCEREGARVAVECDGERYHLDEHGQPKLEDLEREAILRRAGWRIVRIPYRKWLRDSQEEVRTVLNALAQEQRAQDEGATEDPVRLVIPSEANVGVAVQPVKVLNVTATQEAILRSLREGLIDEERILYRARDLLGTRRLTTQFRRFLLGELQQLNQLGLVTKEDHEYFPTPEARSAQLRVSFQPPFRHRSRRYRKWR